MSVIARLRKTSLRISSGIVAIGHGGGGERSVNGSAGGMDSCEKACMSSRMLETRTSACAAGTRADVAAVVGAEGGGMTGLVIAATGG